nr:hypothetical protein [Tanacetum cinerariifolium]
MAADVMKHMDLNFATLDKFEGVDFRRWQNKMHFLLFSMSVVYVLTTPIHDDGDDATNVESSKELWDSLEAKYMAEDASSKKFLVSNFTNYKMTDSRPVLEQYNELFGILRRDAIFDENRLSSVPRPSLRIPNGTKYIDGSVVLEEVTEEDDDVVWWVDSGATVHVCKDRCWFKTYESLNDGSIIHIGNESTTLLNIVDDNIASAFMSTSTLNDSILWHARLGHVHFKRMQDMFKDGLISAFDMDTENTPMDTSETLMPNNGQAVSQLEYSRMIGCLIYAMTCTRPDIAFVVGKLSRYTTNPGTQHWQAILWASKKQTCITGSTMESKIISLPAAGKEAEWLKNLLLEILLWSKPITPISTRCDSAATLAKAYSQMYNRKSSHLGVRHIMIHELITNV